MIKRVGARVIKSQSYKQAWHKATAYVNDRTRLNKLIENVRQKAQGKANGPLAGRWDDFVTMMRLVRAYGVGSYRAVSAQSILLIVAMFIYFLMPADLIPEALIGIGLLDDVALIGWTIKAIQTELHKFRSFEKTVEGQLIQEPPDGVESVVAGL